MISNTCFTSLKLLLHKWGYSENSCRKKPHNLIFKKSISKNKTHTYFPHYKNIYSALGVTRNVLNSLKQPSILTISTSTHKALYHRIHEIHVSKKNLVNFFFLSVHFIYILFPLRSLRSTLQNRSIYIISDLHMHSYIVHKRYNPAFF